MTGVQTCALPISIFFITHDIEEALYLADKIAIMQRLCDGGGFNIYDVDFKRPRDLYLKENTDFQKMRRMLVDKFRLYQGEDCKVD